MRKYILILLYTIISCKSHHAKEQKNNNSFDSVNYTVYKIDSLDNYYLIYAKYNESLYKIVSKKINSYDCNKIKLNLTYQFKIIPVKMDRHRVNDTTISYLSRYEHSLLCYYFDGKTRICVERYMNDLYFADNIKGLCFVKN